MKTKQHLETSQLEYIKGLFFAQRDVSRNTVIQTLWPGVKNPQRIGVVMLRMKSLRHTYGMVIKEKNIKVGKRTIDTVYSFVNLEPRKS